MSREGPIIQACLILPRVASNLELNAAELVNGEKIAKFITGGKLLDSDSRCFEAYCCEPLKMRMGKYSVSQVYCENISTHSAVIHMVVVPGNLHHNSQQLVYGHNCELDGKHSGVEDETFLSPGFDS
nr:3030_t:CDS:2 [Entrophospora candida]